MGQLTVWEGRGGEDSGYRIDAPRQQVPIHLPPHHRPNCCIEKSRSMPSKQRRPRLCRRERRRLPRLHPATPAPYILRGHRHRTGLRGRPTPRTPLSHFEIANLPIDGEPRAAPPCQFPHRRLPHGVGRDLRGIFDCAHLSCDSLGRDLLGVARRKGTPGAGVSRASLIE